MITALDVVITPMRRRHLRAVLAIEQAVNPKPWTQQVLESELDQTDTRVYVVARVGRTVVGFAGVMMALDDGHITNIAVDPSWQRQRIAARLLTVLARSAVARGARALTLEVRLSNKAAQELYRRFSFAPVGVRKGYYQQPDEDALIMWAHDVDQPEFAALLAAHERTTSGTTVVEGLGGETVESGGADSGAGDGPDDRAEDGDLA